MLGSAVILARPSVIRSCVRRDSIEALGFQREMSRLADSAGLVMPSIDEALVRARSWVRRRGLRTEILGSAALWLTLGGILHSVIATETDGALRYGLAACGWLLALLGAPYLRLRTSSNQERVTQVRRLVLRDRRRALEYLLYHLTFSMRDAVKICEELERAIHPPNLATIASLRESRRIEASSEYPVLLARELFDLFGLRTADTLLDYLRFQPERLQAALKQYLEAATEISFKKNNGHARRLEAQAEMKSILLDFSATSSPDLVFIGLEVVSSPGTSGALQELLDQLNRLEGDGRHSDLEPLIELVDTARGASFRTLSDLDRWKPSVGLPNYEKIRTDCREQLNSKFSDFIDARFGNRAARETTIVTSGYSAAVLGCIVGAKPIRKFRVYVIDSESLIRGDSQSMCAELRQHGIPSAVIPLEPSRAQAFVGSADLAVFGFEAMTTEGDLVHPRGIGAALESIAGLDVVAVGESWKVREPSILDGIDLSLVAVSGGDQLNFVVTDCGVHQKLSAGHDFDGLAQVPSEWQRRISG